MSLNGLDTPEVQDAYNTAIAEAGGWFLLKYTSRDSVELLGRGKSGVSEARNAIQSYTEASPLYGLIIYRRRRILIKCIPEGTSRLLQARTAVHFQDVLEKYSPYETLLEITNGEGLNDTALAASFQLRTASASPSPSPSTNRLDEISEDAEDNGDGGESQSRAETPASSLSVPPRHQMDRRTEHMKKFGKRTSSLGVGKPPQLLGQQRSPSPASPLKQSMSQYLVHDEAGHTSITPLESPLPESLPAEVESTVSVKEDSAHHSKDLPEISDTASERTATDASDATEVPVSPKTTRKQTSPAADLRDRELPALPTAESAFIAEERASMSERQVSTHSLADDPYDFSKFDELFKPKVKLAPRPVHSPEKIQSPAVARVSALPASFRPANRKQETPRPKSSGNGLVVPARPPPPAPATYSPPTYIPPPPPPVPETPEYATRPTSRGSTRSAPSHKSHGMTPDKIRLMKAVELRRRQLRKSQEPPSQPIFDDDAPEVPKVPEVSDRIPSRTIKIVRTPEPASEQEQTTDDEGQLESSKADSGIEMHYRKQDKASDDHDLQSTPSASKPSTPEPGTIPTSQATGTPVSPPVIQESPKEIDNAPEEADSHLQPDDASIESKTPTERSEFVVQGPELEATELTPVPTIIMADGSRPMTSDGQAVHSPAEIDDEISNVGDSGTETLEEPPSSPRRQNSDLAKRRRGFVEPLQIDSNSGNPDDFMSDDDDLLDELHSAEIVEARPVTVARSPLTPTFPGRRPSADTLASVRSVNITRMGSFPADRGSDERLTQESPRNIGQRTMTPTGEKGDSTSGLSRNVSSEISKRIQALSLQSRPLTPEVSPNAFAQRPVRSRPTSYRRHSSNRATQSPARGGVKENAPVWNVQHDPTTNRNSVSVTARIVRPNVISESVAEESREVLQPSELVISHERDATKPGSRPASIHTAKAQSETSTPALSPVLSRSSTEARTMHSAGNSRFGRHKHQNSSTPVSTPGLDEFPPPPGARTGGSTPSLISNDENGVPKEGSKASRFMKRMSMLPFGGGNKRKSGAQQQNSAASLVGHETTGAAASAAGTQSRVSSIHEKSDTPPAVVVGDLNVQFPDSLLWKRRIVTIDDSGYLQFAIAQAMEIHKGVALKKFALTDFKLPYVPDLDMQELPYSIMLEFQDGTTLQTACEDAMTQRQVLHILKTYWKSWA